LIFAGSDPGVPTVTSTTGRVWMDRNLGASLVATAYNDSLAYGDLYQWGRDSDGHQARDSDTTNILSPTNNPGHDDFIITSSSPYDWTTSPNNNLWQGVHGLNNPCPAGFRLPTAIELSAERVAWVAEGHPNNRDGAFASPLKLVAAGCRNHYNGTVSSAGSNGYYWSGTDNGSYARYLGFYSGNANVGSYDRAGGDSARCLED